jgi:4-hydroxy-tetrahydrodipicolinate reductase
MSEAVTVVHAGLGPIGAGLARLVAERPELRIVGAADLDPAKEGRDLGEITGLREPLGIVVGANLEAVLKQTQPRVVVQATGSALDQVAPQLESAIRAGARVVSTCEEMAFPYQRHPELAARLDALAKEHGVAILGTGVNPGYAMDALPLMLTAACQRVERVVVTRIQDASDRRLPLQKKVGAGMAVDEFRRKAQDGSVRHVGLPESALLIADTLGWQLERVDDRIDPVVAERTTRSDFIEVPPGGVLGVHQVLSARSAGREVIRLELKMHLGVENPRDEVVIEGFPPIHVVVQGGFKGDPVTAAVVVNAITSVMAAAPGLKTMRDVPLVHGSGV